MTSNTEICSLESTEIVQEIARRIIRISDHAHHALRRLSADIVSSESQISYALLTEEYALRARANILLIEAHRFVLPNFQLPHQEMMANLAKAEARLEEVNQLDELSELLIGIMLFANSLVSKNEEVISFLLSNLARTAAKKISN